MKTFDDIYYRLGKTLLKKGVEQDPNVAVRTKYSDGTPAYTVSIEGVSFEITPDMGVPILRSKRVPLKTPLIEIDWIWREMSNDVNHLNSRGVKIWDEWAQSVRDNTLCYVPSKVYKGNHNGKTLDKVSYAPLVLDYLETRSSNNYGDYNVLRKDYKTQRYEIQFLNTGYISEVTQSQVSLGEVKDYYARSVNGVGYYGNYKSEYLLDGLGKYHKRWVNTWENMIRRCSSDYKEQWEEYRDTYVSSEFQSCENFLTWVVENKPIDTELLSVLQLDKDYYSSDVYSPETCVLLTPKENTGLTLDTWYLYNNEVFTSKLSFAQYVHRVTKGEFGLTPKGRVSTTLNTFMEESFANGTLRIISPKENTALGYPRFSLEWNRTINKAYGYQLRNKTRKIPLEVANMDNCDTEINQVEFVLHELKYNPASRRIMTTLFDVDDLSEMALEPCVWATHWTVHNGKLNLHVKQR